MPNIIGQSSFFLDIHVLCKEVIPAIIGPAF